MLTSPGGCDKTGKEPFSGHEIWPLANVNALEELMHRTLICSASASWRNEWEIVRVCEGFPTSSKFPGNLGHVSYAIEKRSTHAEKPKWKEVFCPH